MSEFTGSFIGKLKAFGNQIENAAGAVGDKVVGAAGSVVGAGTKVVGVVKDLPNAITFNSDFQHIKSINELARQTPVFKEHHYSEKEWTDAEARADAVLSKLYPGYFEQDFDPVKYELEQLSTEAAPEEIDAVVEKLTNGVEVRWGSQRAFTWRNAWRAAHGESNCACCCAQKATGKLSRRVFTKREQLLNGLSTVAAVGDDLKGAFMIVRTSRASLKQAGEEIMRNVRVAGQTRRKQYYMELIQVRSARGSSLRFRSDAGLDGASFTLMISSQVCVNIKRAQDLQRKLKRSQEVGEKRSASDTSSGPSRCETLTPCGIS